MVVSATWGARCGKSARRVLRGGMGPRGHAGSVRPLSRKGQLQRGSAKATAPRPVPTSHSIPHAELMQCIARRISDGKMLHLLKMWLKAPVEDTDERGTRRRSGGKKATRGTPQGGVASPLLANIYMHRYIKAFRKYGLDRRYGAVLQRPATAVPTAEWATCKRVRMVLTKWLSER